ncbi:type I-C CRISPR-associated protein Cas5 [Xylella taiwanensis]|uniref:pre-crRNA processing endonuclease n=1 Tax=Xylella taiwanensis TaxID=1444770 RepID=Z9JJT5_9GAMM|nr:type I-C CRISPR-associated protein Cas5c [Xylella taiwanensis]AXI84369.1 CRISPR-associated protein [Xylella taiwanensis]EWS78076.1 CRISPR-associated protein [Xylella taiwanensis]MCD8457490.1 type I-C CRISPR-associated protein Cas5c [Xylella taiwanensis]MCD8457649.1 type I-C CRISPR-associated protein Cas5c [Xylella taiwanensis]MCD8461226.1 type I-C CRISPR-associated protein Cas5c [Xylella taiwanensis]
MSYGIKLHIWGPRALFTRPEFKVERFSYDVITPSAARGILEAIYWKPEMRWIVDAIQILKPIRFESIRRNEVGSKLSATNASKAMRAGRTDGLVNYVEEDRQPRATTVLRDVGYVIAAHIALTNKAKSDANIGKYLDIFKRRARRGRCFQSPCLGTREFPAHFSLIEDNSSAPESDFTLIGERDLGWILHDIDFTHGIAPRFFRAHMINGLIKVPTLSSGEIHT